MQYKYASFWERWLAALLDELVWSIGLVIVVLLVSLFYATKVESFFVGVGFGLLYLASINMLFRTLVQPYLISRFGGSIGKLVFGQEVILKDNQKITYTRAFFREFIAKQASALLFGVGFYWIFRTSDRQAWHDMLSDSYVINKTDKGLLYGLLAIFLLLITQVLIVVFAFINVTANLNGLDYYKQPPSYRTLPTETPDVYPNNRQFTPPSKPSNI